MDTLYIYIIFLLDFINSAKGGSCYFSYYLCDGYAWCCPDGYVCTGSSTCLSIGAIVGACIGAIVGIVIFAILIYLCCRSKKGTVGTVVANPGGGTTVVSTGQMQYGQPQYGQPQYGQPQYGQPQYGQPQYGQPPQYAQPYEQPSVQPGGSYPPVDPVYPPKS